jgi:preprotein translocase subunit YajC
MPQALIAVGIIVAQTEDGTGSTGGAGNLLGFLLPLIILGGLFYVMLYLPRRRQQKKAQEMLEAISVGDDIRTIGGIYGKIRSEDDDTYTIDLGDGTRMRIAKRAVAERIGDDE